MADEIFDPSFRKYPDGSSGPVFGPPPAGQVVVTMRYGALLPKASRTPAKANPGETVSVDATEAGDLIRDGWAEREGDPVLPLDEAATIVSVKRPFRFRGLDFRAGAVVRLPVWFVTKARALELVGDPPARESAPAMKPETKQAIESRRIQRQRKIAHDYLETLQ